MALIDRLKPHYEIIVRCDNCDKKVNVKIKKGILVSDAVTNQQVKCSFCGCIITPTEYDTPYTIPKTPKNQQPPRQKPKIARGKKEVNYWGVGEVDKEVDYNA